MKVFNCSNIKFLIKNSFSKSCAAPCLYRCFSTESSSNNTQNPTESQAKITKIKKIYRFDLSPHAYWLMQGQGMERPFTGDYWFTKDTGHYTCLACSNKLFL